MENTDQIISPPHPLPPPTRRLLAPLNVTTDQGRHWQPVRSLTSIANRYYCIFQLLFTSITIRGPQLSAMTTRSL